MTRLECRICEHASEAHEPFTNCAALGCRLCKTHEPQAAVTGGRACARASYLLGLLTPAPDAFAVALGRMLADAWDDGHGAEVTTRNPYVNASAEGTGLATAETKDPQAGTSAGVLKPFTRADLNKDVRVKETGDIGRIMDVNLDSGRVLVSGLNVRWWFKPEDLERSHVLAPLGCISHGRLQGYRSGAAGKVKLAQPR